MSRAQWVGRCRAWLCCCPRFSNRATWGLSGGPPPAGSLVPSILRSSFPGGLFLLALATLWIMLNEPGRRLWSSRFRLPSGPRGFRSAIPLAGYVLAKLVTHAFVDRTSLASCRAWRWASPARLRRRFPGPGAVPLGILLLLLGYGRSGTNLVGAEYRPASRLRSRATTDPRVAGPGRAVPGARQTLHSSSTPSTESSSSSCRPATIQHPERYVYWTHLDPATPPSPVSRMQSWTLDQVKAHADESVFVDMAPQSREAPLNWESAWSFRSRDR